MNVVTLAYMCSLFGFMRELFQEADISTDSTMILDKDPVAQKERWVFADDDCDDYFLLTWRYSECTDYSMDYVTRRPYDFTGCITTHFMTEMGTKSKCSDDSVRPDSDTDDTNTITLLSKDRHFYSFMVDTLDAGNICQATNDTVTLSTGYCGWNPCDCDWYNSLVKQYHVGSRCTYNTPSTDTDTELHYDYCLDYRLMKSLGADSVCANRMTLDYMCSLFGLMREWLQEGGVSTDSTLILDNDATVQEESQFSYVDCVDYHWNTKWFPGCIDGSIVYNTDPKRLNRLILCITTHFMTNMVVRSSCYDHSVRLDNDTHDKKTVTLLSKDRSFYTSMVHILNKGNMCQATNDNVILSDENCGWYINLIKKDHAESRCAYNTPSIDSEMELSYSKCLQYRFMKSLGADTVCAQYTPRTNRRTLAYMCSLFGFMKEWLQKGDISTENAMIYDTDTITQNEWLFSDADCSYYHTLTDYYGECVGDTLTYESKELHGFTGCITTHFMTEMGALTSCYDDSVRPNSDRNVTTMTLLSRNRHFYSFMVDTLDAGNICQARNDAVRFDAFSCDWYITLVRTYHAESRCTYNTPSTDSDIELDYHDCLQYRWMKSLGADNVCANKMTLAYMCSLFGFMKEWLQKSDISTDSAMILDSDTFVQKERWMFSDDDCDAYSSLTEHYSECVFHSMLYVTDPNGLYVFTSCITTHFMTEAGANNNCPDDSVRPDSDTYDTNTITSLSKDRLFYTFMVDTLDAGNTCPTNDIVTLSADNCDRYVSFMKEDHARSRCAYKTNRIDSDAESSYSKCLEYRFMKSLGADRVCANNMTLAYICSLFGFMREWLQEGDISTENAMFFDTDTIVHKVWKFSDADCDDYHKLTRLYKECVNDTLMYETNPKKPYGCTACITTHFMTKMGARNRCHDYSQRRNKTMTLWSKDKLFYNFMVDTLDAENTCPSSNDTVTLSADYCGRYISFVMEHHARSRCAYKTKRINSDTELSYSKCLEYRLMKSLGADRVCANRMNLAYMCSLFGFMKEWLRKGGISTESTKKKKKKKISKESTMIYDKDTITQTEMKISDADCNDYHKFTTYYRECVDDSLMYETNPEQHHGFVACMATHFMTEMGARRSCYDNDVRSDDDTNVTKTMTLLSKDSLFYNFMIDTLNAGNICPSTNDIVTLLSTDDCDRYVRYLVKKNRAGSRCAYSNPRIDSDTEISYSKCLEYRLMKSLGVERVCANGMILTYICSLFGFMKEWLQKWDSSEDNTMIYDTDTMVQGERKFSDADCDRYNYNTVLLEECIHDTMMYERDPVQPHEFIECITTHFMTNMGARSSCSDDSVRSDNDTHVRKTMTLLSKDTFFYSFMVDTLNVGNFCPATDDTVTFSADCDFYTKVIDEHNLGSGCRYKKPRTDSDTDLRYSDCLYFRLMKSLSVDSMCGDDMTLAYMCSLFGFIKKWLQEDGPSTESTMTYDTNTIVQKERMFSDADCADYHLHRMVAVCEYHSMLFETDPKQLDEFFNCVRTHFMNEMGARSSCSGDSVKSDNDTKVNNTKTLLSKDRLFYSFMADTLNGGNICPATDNNVTLSADNCDWYIKRIKYYYAEITCAPRTNGSEELPFRTYAMCLQYRWMKSLEADTVCQISLYKSCFAYYDIVQSLIPTCICVIGLIGNLLSLWMFCSGAVNIPTAYQLQWLESVDITFIVTWWIVFVLPDTLYYFNAYSDHYRDWIQPVLYVCFRPLSNVARSCTVWLTVLIGLYRYLAICHPSNNLTFHATRHGHKYVVLVVILSFLYNIPYFGEYYLHQEGFSRAYKRTDFVSKELLNVIYPSRVHSVIVVGVPCLILIFVTVSILVELRKREKKKRNMQTTQSTQTTQNSVTPMFVTILITFILCELPYFVWYGFGEVKIKPTYDYLDCGSFMFYIRWLINLGLLLNSSANGFIYFFLNKTFRDALSARCPC